tara:strand:+ start:117 stop:425 length:309 start_codon:yes stop_codon:yes gene_type:complete
MKYKTMFCIAALCALAAMFVIPVTKLPAPDGGTVCLNNFDFTSPAPVVLAASSDRIPGVSVHVDLTRHEDSCFTASRIHKSLFAMKTPGPAIEMKTSYRLRC